MSIQLYGYKYSVYSWIARFALHEKGISYDWVEYNPFVDSEDDQYYELHPFGAVPSLADETFRLYETNAIIRYIDEAYEGPCLQPKVIEQRARMNQIISVVDSYGYQPFVRQVFTHGVFLTSMNVPNVIEEYNKGIEKSSRILNALEGLAEGKNFLVSDEFSLADIYLAPVLTYLSYDPQGSKILSGYKKLSRWLLSIECRKAFKETVPSFSFAQP